MHLHKSRRSTSNVRVIRDKTGNTYREVSVSHEDISEQIKRLKRRRSKLDRAIAALEAFIAGTDPV